MADVSKIKLPNGTTYSLKDSGAFRKKAVVMSTNPFATPSDEHGSSALYIPKIDDALFCADMRFNVSVTGEYIQFNGISSLFNGSYDGNNLRIADDKSVVITFDFSNLYGQKFPGYPYGFIYLTFYASQNPKSLSGRVYNNYASQGVGWYNVEFTNCFGGVWVCEQKYYGLQTLEITIVGDGTNSYGYTTLSEIDMHLTRPDPSNVPYVSKYSKQTLYYDLTAPKFIGSGASLTNLNGSNISSGTVPAARLPAASQSSAGIMSAQDKVKLDGIDAGANKITTDSSISSGSTSTNVPTSAAVASFVESKGYILSTQKGVANGLAELDENGKVPSSQLPSYVDEVLEFSNRDNFPLTGKSGIIYIDTNTNLTYRWGGSDYIEISPSLALGTTSSTAFRGDYGNTAYSHATDSSRLTTAKTTGLYKIATTAQGHIASATAVTKADITALGIPASDTTYTFDGTYNASTNKAATVNTVTTAINALGAAATKGVTDNTTATAPSSSDTNLITGRTLYYAIASNADIDALFQ